MARPLHLSVGAAGVALLMAMVPDFEGMILRGYKDPIGIVTACAGHTKTAVLGRAYTREECEKFLVEDLAEHAEIVDRCVKVTLKFYEKAAYVSFAYNVGPGKEGVRDGFCVLKSGRTPTFLRRLNSGDHAGACDGLLDWTKAGGEELPGLVRRRAAERAVCLGEIGDDESTVERDGGRVGAFDSRLLGRGRGHARHRKDRLRRVRRRRGPAHYGVGRLHGRRHAARVTWAS